VTATYNLATDVGVARLLCADTNLTEPLLTDEDYAALLSLEGDDIKLAAAQALDSIATNEALVQKVIRILDLSTDGSKTAQALMARAKALREQVAADQAAAEAGTDWDWAEQVQDAASERERIINQALRGAI
jgi:hypothetical protein